MRRLALLLLVCPLIGSAQSVKIGNGVTIGTGVTAGLTFTPTPPPPSGIVFTPAAGPYTGTQNVAITQTYGAGNRLFYTTNGFPVSEANTLFSSTIPLSSTTTVNALAESVGSVIQNFQSSLSGHKICTPLGGGPGTPTSVVCGGVGSNQPSGWTVSTDGTTMFYSVSGTGGTPQILVTGGGSGCDSCTKETQHFRLQPVANTHMQNIEADMWHNDGTRNRLHMFGLQCNQQNGIKQWQIDNEQGSWQNTGITDNCPMTAGVYTDVVFEGHWIIGDTGCGGLGCTYYDNLYINGVKHVINRTLENDSRGWASGCASQKQLDLNPGATPSNPFTASFNVQQDNVTCSFGTQGTSFATYTF